MGFFSAIGSAISSAVSTVCSAVSSIGSALGSFATSVGSIIMKALPVVSNIARAVGTVLGVIKPQETPEEIGDRAFQAADAGIHPENFDKYEEYADAIRNFQLDPEKSAMRSPEEKKLAGVGVISKLVEEKYTLRDGSVGELFALTALNPTYFNEQRLEKWIHSGKDVGKIVDYFNNKMGASDSFKVEQDLIKAEQADSTKTEAQIEREIEQAKTDVYEAAQKAAQ